MSNNRSKYLSLLLRHKPENANLTLDKEGWCSLRQLLENTDFTMDEIDSIVENDEKNRYTISDDWLKIRANQGHSTAKVKLTFKKAIPPVVLYHGTTASAWTVIAKTGLQPMSRHHVHLSHDVATAKVVGGRRHSPMVILAIDAKQMLADGYTFYISENGVWLADHVPKKYITEV